MYYYFLAAVLCAASFEFLCVNSDSIPAAAGERKSVTIRGFYRFGNI
jgi:hypothetical protein